MYFKNSEGIVYLTEDSVIVDSGLCITTIKPKDGVPKKQFLKFEYENQIELLKNLEHIHSW